jgi:hypothetical protein
MIPTIDHLQQLYIQASYMVSYIYIFNKRLEGSCTSRLFMGWIKITKILQPSHDHSDKNFAEK